MRFGLCLSILRFSLSLSLRLPKRNGEKLQLNRLVNHQVGSEATDSAVPAEISASVYKPRNDSVMQ